MYDRGNLVQYHIRHSLVGNPALGTSPVSPNPPQATRPIDRSSYEKCGHTARSETMQASECQDLQKARDTDTEIQ